MRFSGVTESINQKVISSIINQIFLILPKISDENLVKLTYLGEKLTADKGIKNNIKIVRQRWIEKHPSTILAKSIITNLSPACREKLVKNLFVNWIFLGGSKRINFRDKEGFLPPALIVISPTMQCNLRCHGCYAGGYQKEASLSYKAIENILNECKQLGVYFVVISGGEPFMCPYLLKLFEKHNDIYFLAYTNGTLIDKNLAAKLSKLGNVTPAISVEGFENETDARRGKGVYSKVMQAMDNLREAGVLFGFSATPTAKNSDTLASNEFIDFYIKKGCSYGWFFQYIPIGRKPNISMMETPKQRNKLREKVREWRDKKAIFIGDFWNDGPYVRGCMAGGRNYLHINSKGDIEPCVFTHFATHNIRDTTIRGALESKFFKLIRERQKGIKNLLMPCIIIDNPGILRDVCKKCNAKPTHEGAETIIKNKRIIKHLNKYSREICGLTKDVWEKEYKQIASNFM